MNGLTTFQIIFIVAYTTTAMIAVTLHGLNLREAWKNQKAMKQYPDPLGKEVASMMVRVEATRMAKAVLIFLVGAFALSGFRAGYLLVPIPLIGIFASWADLRSRERQAIYAERALSDARAEAVSKK
jgi:hypothetical protein